MTYGSLFTGIGGFDLGFDQAGMTCKWQCEIDKNARKVLEKHWPDVMRYEDVKEVSHPERVDVICGGSPCQGFSMAGLGKGLSDERSALVYEFFRIVQLLRPKWVVLENVPQLLKTNRGRDFGAVLGKLGDSGYQWAYRVLDAESFGLPQERRRLFVVGHFGEPCPPEILFEPESLSRGSESRTQKASSSPGRSDEVASFFWQSGGSRNLLQIKAERVGAIHRGQTPALFSRTLPPRRMTPIEIERCFGFPDDFTDGLSDTGRYKVLGNAVCPPQAKWIGKRLMEVSA